MTTLDLLTFLVSSGALVAGWKAAYNSGKFVEKLDNHIAETNRRLEEHDDDIKAIQNKLWSPWK